MPRRVERAVRRGPKQPAQPPRDWSFSVPPAVSIPHIGGAMMPVDRRGTLAVSDASLLMAQHDAFDANSLADKAMDTSDYATSEHDELTREADELRRRVAVLRAASDSESGSEPVEPVPAPASTDTLKKDVPYSPTRSRPATSTFAGSHMEFENEVLRRELSLLRAEMARLQARVIGAQADDWGPPPAYA